MVLDIFGIDMPGEDWITTTEACRMSGYHPYYLREIIRKGYIRAQKFGPIWQVERQSLLTYIEEARATGDKRRGPRGKHG
jgi:excisionase family DNA binding protein